MKLHYTKLWSKY